MNILYLSKLTGNLFAGPNYSVPEQINAQRKIDNVFWYNLNNVKRKEWISMHCKNLTDYPSGKLKDLPQPFNNPDIVIIEEFYCHVFDTTVKDVQRKKIPYIIIPRSQMTIQAQKKNHLKKVIGNLIYFKNLAKNAIAIQYLSKQEQLDSGSKWNNKSIIIPNGTKEKNKIKNKFSSNKIKAIYIGRYEKYQKGLDLLFAAIGIKQRLLRENNFVLEMYGVNQGRTLYELEEMMRKLKISDLISINNTLFGEKKEEKLLEADLFIMSSRFEGMPMGLIEALSVGLPVLVSKGTNMAGEIKENNAGWVAENDEYSLAEAFGKMIVEKNMFEEKSKNAIKLSEKYLWDNIALGTHKIYKDLLLAKLQK